MQPSARFLRSDGEELPSREPCTAQVPTGGSRSPCSFRRILEAHPSLLRFESRRAIALESAQRSGGSSLRHYTVGPHRRRQRRRPRPRPRQRRRPQPPRPRLRRWRLLSPSSQNNQRTKRFFRAIPRASPPRRRALRPPVSSGSTHPTAAQAGRRPPAPPRPRRPTPSRRRARRTATSTKRCSRTPADPQQPTPRH